MAGFLKKLLPHLLALLCFVIISLAYFYPVLQGKEIYQSDIVQYTGMAKEQNDFRAETGEEPYWTDAAFGGMPTYQLGANYPHNYIKEFDRVLRFLPRPADYLFLYFIGLYVLLLVLKVDYRLAFLGALAFGFSTYLIIILGVGHNAKAHAIAYMPLVLAGILLCFRSKYLGGFLLLAVGMALEIGANHFQMTYYLLLLVLVLGLVYLVHAWKKKGLPEFFKSLAVMVGAVVLAIGVNATNLLATQEYTEFSTRRDTGLTINPDGSQKQLGGLDHSYITQYSYGILETFNLFIPRFMGGSSAEDIGKDSQVYEELIKIGVNPVHATDFVKNAPTYWGGQPYVGAPAYVGATVLFLFILALYLVRGRLKWWIIGGSLLALLLSWGKNFGLLTDFFIDYVPLYNKFRAVSSIQVIIELCVPILAVVGLSKFLFSGETNEQKLFALKRSTIIAGGLALIFLLFNSIFLSFTGPDDQAMIHLGRRFLAALQEDRQAIFTYDTIRSLLLVLLVALVLWLFLKDKLNRNKAIGALTVLILFDLVGIGLRYVNSEDFVKASVMKEPFQPTQADQQIMQDTGHYRVFDLSGDPFNTGRTSYFHNSIGGYHAAKPGRMQDLIEFHIANNNMEVLNMLNTKYFIVPGEGQAVVQENPDAFGNAWFVEEVKLVDNADEAIQALGETDLRTTAVIDREMAEGIEGQDLSVDQNSTIELVEYQPNQIEYRYTADKEQLAVFSEIYYPNGWNAYIDGERFPHFRADYVLRAMKLPAGEHSLIFKFEPEVVQTGSSIALISSVLLLLALVGAGVYSYRKRDEE